MNTHNFQDLIHLFLSKANIGQTQKRIRFQSLNLLRGSPPEIKYFQYWSRSSRDARAPCDYKA